MRLEMREKNADAKNVYFNVMRFMREFDEYIDMMRVLINATVICMW